MRSCTASKRCFRPGARSYERAKGDERRLDEKRKSGAWERFLDQRTGPQRFLIALAGIVTALGIVGAGFYTFVDWVGDRSSATDRASTVAGGRIEQGSPEADTFVRKLLEAQGQRLELDVVVDAPAEYPPGGLPPEGVIYAGVPLFYNCQGKPPGNDNCNSAGLEFGDVHPPPTVRSPLGVHFRGTYAIRIREGTIFGTNLAIVVLDVNG